MAERVAPVAVTGVGIVSPLGVGREQFWRALSAGVSGIQPLAGAFDNRPQWDEPPRARTLHRPVALGNLGIEIGHGYHSITARALTRPILTRFLLQAMDSYLVVNGILDYSAMYQFYFKQYTGSS